MEEKVNIERRRYVRFKLDTTVHYRTKKVAQKEGPAQTLTSKSRNMSVEGICFIAHEALVAGTRLELEVLLPGESEPLLLRGEVRWSRSVEPISGKESFEVGVRLITLDNSNEGSYIRYICDKMNERLKRYLEANKEEF